MPTMNAFCTLATLLGKDCSKVGHHLDVLHAKFAAHVADYGLSYGTDDEYVFRMQVFSVNEEKINELKDKYNSFEVAHNKYSTWTDQEMD